MSRDLKEFAPAPMPLPTAVIYDGTQLDQYPAPGTIFYGSWGYDQTNIDWYMLIECHFTKTGQMWGSFVSISKQYTESGYMSGRSVPSPVPRALSGQFRKRLRTYEFGGRRVWTFTRESYDHPSTWDGTSKYESSYA